VDVDETRASNLGLVSNASELRTRQDVSGKLAWICAELLSERHGEVRLEVSELRIATGTYVRVRLLCGQSRDCSDRCTECAFKCGRWINRGGGFGGRDGGGHVEKDRRSVNPGAYWARQAQTDQLI
jgi:hypothetical protein